jgi:hypothetical protein
MHSLEQRMERMVTPTVSNARIQLMRVFLIRRRRHEWNHNDDDDGSFGRERSTTVSQTTSDSMGRHQSYQCLFDDWTIQLILMTTADPEEA